MKADLQFYEEMSSVLSCSRASLEFMWIVADFGPTVPISNFRVA